MGRGGWNAVPTHASTPKPTLGEERWRGLKDGSTLPLWWLLWRCQRLAPLYHCCAAHTCTLEPTIWLVRVKSPLPGANSIPFLQEIMLTSNTTIYLQISEVVITGAHKPFPIFKLAPCLNYATQCTKGTLGSASYVRRYVQQLLYCSQSLRL